MQQALVDYTRALQIDPRGVLTVWNQNATEAGRLQTTQQLSDFIDGLRPEKTEAPEPVLSAPTFVSCPICHRMTIRAETLPDGRVRCGTCRNMFLPSAVATPAAVPPSPATEEKPPERKPSAQTPSRPPVKKADTEDEAPFWKIWKGPLGLAAAAVILVLVVAGWRLWRTDRVRVHPASGQVFFEEKPIPGGLVMLDPTWMKQPTFPRPRAVVKDDGSFVLETYGKGDGVPAGDYRVLVIWAVKTNKEVEVEGGSLPKNVLPPRYGKFDTSGLRVTIKEGKNQIPAIKLTR